jgi:16S rRNA (guanine966-N2)-methyltransferase
VAQVVLSAPSEPFDLLFLDPPYEVAGAVLSQILTNLVEQQWLADGATVVVERAVRSAAIDWPRGFEIAEPKKYGDTALVTGIWYGLDT